MLYMYFSTATLYFGPKANEALKVSYCVVDRRSRVMIAHNTVLYFKNSIEPPNHSIQKSAREQFISYLRQVKLEANYDAPLILASWDLERDLAELRKMVPGANWDELFSPFKCDVRSIIVDANIDLFETVFDGYTELENYFHNSEVVEGVGCIYNVTFIPYYTYKLHQRHETGQLRHDYISKIEIEDE